jgi:hypothetical protein
MRNDTNASHDENSRHADTTEIFLDIGMPISFTIELFERHSLLAHHHLPLFTLIISIMTAAPSPRPNNPLSFAIRQTKRTHISVVPSMTMSRSNKVSKYQLIFYE